jgi:hypothetical protein
MGAAWRGVDKFAQKNLKGSGRSESRRKLRRRRPGADGRCSVFWDLRHGCYSPKEARHLDSLYSGFGS